MRASRMTAVFIAALLLAGCAAKPPAQPAAQTDQAPAAANPAPQPAPTPDPASQPTPDPASQTTPDPASRPAANPGPAQTPALVDQPTSTLNQPQPEPSASAPTPPSPTAPAPLLPPEEAIRLRADAVLTALEQADPALLADLVHPEKGVRFSPYAFVQTDRDLVFTPEELRAADPAAVYEWGAYDGSGEPIRMTLTEYLRSVFVYGEDYRSAPQVGVDEALRTGNSIHNIPEAYPQGHFIEFHFPGSPANDHMDWSSLRLVFEESDGTWYLVGVVHDQWTI